MRIGWIGAGALAVCVAWAALGEGEGPDPGPPLPPSVQKRVKGVEEAMEAFTPSMRRKEKLLVVWLFDQSLSMEDDRRRIAKSVDGMFKTLRSRVKHKEDLSMAVCAFGEKLTQVLEPTQDEKKVKQAIESIPNDTSGKESTLRSIRAVCESLRNNPAQRVLVLVTDEAGDDVGDKPLLEELEKQMVRDDVQLFCIGSEAAFQRCSFREFVKFVAEGKERGGSVYLKLGPESSEIEICGGILKFYCGSSAVGFRGSSLHPLYASETPVPSGFGYYAFTRLALATKGGYLMLEPEEESGKKERGKEKETLFAIDRRKMARYAPDYGPPPPDEEEIARKMAKRILDHYKKSIDPKVRALSDELYAWPTEKAEALASAQVDRGRVYLQLVEETAAALRSDLDKLPSAGGPKRKYATGPRWEANALLSLALLEAEKTMLGKRIGLFESAVKEGRFRPSEKKASEKYCGATFYAGKKYPVQQQEKGRKYSDPLDPIAILQKDHAGTPWAWCAERIGLYEEELKVYFYTSTGVAPPQPPGR